MVLERKSWKSLALKAQVNKQRPQSGKTSFRTRGYLVRKSICFTTDKVGYVILSRFQKEVHKRLIEKETISLHIYPVLIPQG